MSLLEKAMSSFRYINKTPEPDGEGGIKITWTEGVEFLADARLDSSTQAKIAEKMGVTSLYTITVKKNIPLMNNDIVKRMRDGKIFRVTSNGDDKKTPDGAGLDMRQVTAEEWVIPL